MLNTVIKIILSVRITVTLQNISTPYMRKNTKTTNIRNAKRPLKISVRCAYKAFISVKSTKADVKDFFPSAATYVLKLVHEWGSNKNHTYIYKYL